MATQAISNCGSACHAMTGSKPIRSTRAPIITAATARGPGGTCPSKALPKALVRRGEENGYSGASGCRSLMDEQIPYWRIL
ncbi:hypothetical protein ACFCXT_00910 [Streptomyces vinaceus]|uniref:hypothetical protein n=1 Tax=Streptomyces vinaceus TaxID=1960 RepID=UPI0035D5BFF6